MSKIQWLQLFKFLVSSEYIDQKKKKEQKRSCHLGLLPLLKSAMDFFQTKPLIKEIISKFIVIKLIS